ncbi:MAG: hypothetical protein WA861_17070 [Candidatus Binatus sp.]
MKNRTLRLAATIASALFFAASLSACAPTESEVSSVQSEQALQRLQAARALDLGNALDPAVGPAASGDYSIRADRAEQVMNDLEHGQDVSQAQIDEASFVPPKSLSPALRSELIRELQQAKNLDDRGWWDWTRDPIIAQDFSVQEKKASRAIKDLETSQQLSWSEIDAGLEVPQYP